MRAFLTGSRAYGTPRETSDTDLVVFVTEKDIEVLISQGHQRDFGSGTGLGNVSLRFGGMNLICLTDITDYEIWAEGTKRLIERAPVTRQEAVAMFDRLYEKVKKLELRKPPVGVEVKLLELVRVPGTRQLWPADFESFITKIESAPDDKLHWGVCADWLDEQDEPELADGFRWVSKRPSVEVKEVGGAWEFGGLPHAVRACYSVYGGFDLKTVPGLVASLVFALKKVREDAQ